MSVEVACACGKTYRVDESAIGRKARCKSCGQSFVVEPVVALEDEEETFALADDRHDDREDADDERDESPAAQDGRPYVEPGLPEVGGPLAAGGFGTFASNAARLRLDFKAPAFRTPMVIVPAIFFILLGAVPLARGFPYLAWVPPAIGIYLWIERVRGINSKLAGGDVCAAMIVSERPWRVAVYTDLGTGGRRRPAIRIQHVDGLGSMTDGPPEVGRRTAAVAVYHGNPSADAWRDFDPSVVTMITSKVPQVRRLEESVSDADWRALAAGLRKIDVNVNGFYKLWESPLKNTGGTLKTGPVGEWGLMATIGAVALAIACFGQPKNTQQNREWSAPSEPAAPARVESARATPARTPAPSPPAVAAPARPPAPNPPPAPIPPVATTPPVATPGPDNAANAIESRTRAQPEAARATPPVPMPAPAAAVAATVRPASSWNPGDRAEINRDGKWVGGFVVRREGRRLLVHYDVGATEEWVAADRVRRPASK